MIIHVQYQDLRYDYIEAGSLEKLIKTKTIRQFCRPFLNEWVNVEEGPIRKADIPYTGPERRQLYLVGR
jgi:hypothetical protein